MPTNRPHGSESGRVPVYILAGGGSRRFGTDKARAEIDGVPMVVRVARLLAPVSRSITVVAHRDGEYDDLGLRTIGDTIPGRGPAAGLLTALRDLDPATSGEDDGWILLSACDWKGMRSEWVGQLLERRRGSVQAVVFHSGVLEPLFGLYHRSLEDVVADYVAAGAPSMQEILRSATTVVVPAPSGWGGVTNVNRPEDLA